MTIELQVTEATSVAGELATIAERWDDVGEVSGGTELSTGGLGSAIGRLLAADRALSAHAAEEVAGFATDVASMVDRAHAADQW